MMKMWSNWNSSEVSQPVYVLLNSVKKILKTTLFPPVNVRQEDVIFKGKTAGEKRCKLWERQDFLGKADMGPSSFS